MYNNPPKTPPEHQQKKNQQNRIKTLNTLYVDPCPLAVLCDRVLMKQNFALAFPFCKRLAWE